MISNVSNMTIFQISATVGIAQNRYSTIIILLKLLDIKNKKSSSGLFSCSYDVWMQE